MGDLRRFGEFVLPGQAVGAILSLPILEMSTGMPVLTLYGFGRERQIEITGRLALGDYRQNEVRARRPELVAGEAYAGVTVLDGGGRGLTTAQLVELAGIVGVGVEDIRVLDMATGHVDMADPTAGMVTKVIATGVTFADLTSGRVMYLPAGNGLVAALQATTIYGLSEAWPRTIRLNRRPDGGFGVDEIVDPQALRQVGVQLGLRWRTEEAPVLVPRDVLQRAAAALAHYESIDWGGDSADPVGGLAGELRALLGQ